MKKKILMLTMVILIMPVLSAKAEETADPGPGAPDKAENVTDVQWEDVGIPQREEIDSEIVAKEMKFYKCSILRLVREARKNIKKIDKELASK